MACQPLSVIPIINDTLDEADVETFTLRLDLAGSDRASLAGDVSVLTSTGVYLGRRPDAGVSPNPPKAWIG